MSLPDLLRDTLRRQGHTPSPALLPEVVRRQLQAIVIGSARQIGLHLFDEAWQVYAEASGIDGAYNVGSSGAEKFLRILAHEKNSVTTTLEALQILLLHLQSSYLPTGYVPSQEEWTRWHRTGRQPSYSDVALSEIKTMTTKINQALIRADIPYQFDGGMFLPTETQWTHDQVVRPALRFLSDPSFAGANAEFMQAYDHFKHGRYDTCMAECGNAFESVMKVVCVERGIRLKNNQVADLNNIRRATAGDMMPGIAKELLLPGWTVDQVKAMEQVLAFSVPSIRNLGGAGHGAGAIHPNFPRYFASYALHMAASNIVLLAEAHQALPRRK